MSSVGAGKMVVVGHRGACGYAAENTLASFRQAMALGCDRTELDVHLSADGHLIVMHDSTIDRTTNGAGEVAMLTLEQLKTFRCENGEPIPTLEEVITLCKGKIDLQIELKAPGTPALVYSILQRFGLLESTIISSFSSELLTELQAIDPSTKRLWLFRELPVGLWPTAESLQLYAIGPRADIVTSSLVGEAHRRNLKVYAYRTNSPELGKAVRSCGVDEIGTDFPNFFLS